MGIFQAIEEGYEYCMREHSEGKLLHLTDVVSEPGDYANTTLFLCEKEPRFHGTDWENLNTLIIEDLDNQEEFYSDESFTEATDGCEDLLKQLADKINENMSKRPFWFPTKIVLTYKPI